MRFFALAIFICLVCGCLQAPDAGLATTTSTSFGSAKTTSAPESPTTTEMDIAYSVPTTYATTSTTPVSSSGETTSTTLNTLIRTFQDNRGPVCKIEGKPVIRMYSRSDCEHCNWSGPVFDRLANDYVEAGSIVAHHWVFDKDIDALAVVNESGIPESEMQVFRDGKSLTVPYFSFGCRFTRIGNGYYVRDRLDMEADEFRAVIEQLIS